MEIGCRFGEIGVAGAPIRLLRRSPEPKILPETEHRGASPPLGML